MPHRRPTIFIIDDDTSVRRALGRVMTSAGLDHQAYDCAEDFLNEAPQTSVGCIVADMTLPGLSGLETFAALRELDPSAKIILSSGYSKAESLEKLENSKPTGFLPKPYRLQTILHLVAEHLA